MKGKAAFPFIAGDEYSKHKPIMALYGGIGQVTAAVYEGAPSGGNVEIISRDGDCTVCRLCAGAGDMLMTRYAVFPGIELVYNDVHMQSCFEQGTPADNIFKINHCREGRVECEFEDKYCCLGSGDLVLSRAADGGRGFYFPTSYYHGISIIIDVDKAPECLSCFLDDVTVSPAALAEKFCGGGSFIMRADTGIEHIFSELYSVRDSIKKGYFKVKVLELLLFLSALDEELNQSGDHCISETQLNLAKRVCKYLTENMDRRVTTERLSEIFHVSGTQIKNSFKAVYGMSVYAFIRKRKMEAAADMLKKTDCSVLDIAGRFGYDNGSKFAKAFRDAMGETPSEYRCKNSTGK